MNDDAKKRGKVRAEVREQERLAREAFREGAVAKPKHSKVETEAEKRARWARLYPTTDSAGTRAAGIVEDRLRNGKTRAEIMAELERRGLPIPDDWR